MSIHTIRMPDIGEGIAEVEIVEWHVKLGDSVAEDQALCDVMTDKAAVAIPSPVAGRVVALGGEVGQVLAVGSDLIRIESNGGAAAGEVAAPAPAPAAAVSAPSPVAAPVPTPSAPAHAPTPARTGATSPVPTPPALAPATAAAPRSSH